MVEALGRENPIRKVGFVSANGVFDRQSADKHRRNGNNAFYPVHDTANLDIVQDEIAFKLVSQSNNPYGASRNRLPVLTSLNGMLVPAGENPKTDEENVALLQKQIVPMGIAVDRIEYAEESVHQMGRKQIAVQTNGVATVRSVKDKDIPIGTWVSAVVPLPNDDSPHRKALGGKVTLQIAPSFKSKEDPGPNDSRDHLGDTSFAQRYTDLILANKDYEGNDPVFLMCKSIWKDLFESLSEIANRVAEEAEKAAEEDGADADDVAAAARQAAITVNKKLANEKENQKIVISQHLATLSDLVRMEATQVLGKVIRAKNGVYDVVM